MHGNNKSSFFIKTIKQRFNYQVQNYYVCLNNPMTSPTFFVKSSFGDKNEAFSGVALILAELMCEDIWTVMRVFPHQKWEVWNQNPDQGKDIKGYNGIKYHCNSNGAMELWRIKIHAY